MKFSFSKTKEYLNIAMEFIIFAYAVYGLQYAKEIPEDAMVEVPLRQAILVFWLFAIMGAYFMFFRHEAEHEGEEQEEKVKQEEKKTEEELKPYEERTFPFKIDRAKALRLLMYAAFVAAAIIQYTRVYGGVGP